MKRILLLVAVLISIGASAQNPQKLGAPNTFVFVPGMFIADSVALIFDPGTDTAHARAAYPAMPMIGRTAWENGLPYVLTVAGWQCLVGGGGGTATDTTALSYRIDLKENSANKSANSDFTGANDTEFPTRKAVKDFLASQLSSKVNTSDVGVTVASVTQLNTKQDALGYTAENVSNKSNSIDGSSTKYPSNLAVNNALSGKVNTSDTVSLSAITGRVAAGTNVTITGAGTYASPYSISASGGTLDTSRSYTWLAPQTILSSTTPQLKIKNGSSDSLLISEANNGAVTFDANGTGAGFTFADQLTARGNVLIKTSGSATVGVNGYKFVVENSDLTAAYTADLPSSSLSGRAFAIGTSTEAYTRSIFYSNGAYGVGSGSASRDVFLTRSAVGTFKIGGDYDGSGTGHLVVNSTLSVGSGSNAASSAVADFTSTTKGFLPPRVITTQRDAISSPAEGLQVFNTTTHHPNFYDGTSWAQGMLKKDSADYVTPAALATAVAAGGGGGTDDSTWEAITVGNKPQTVGTLLHTDFAGTSITGFSAGSQITVGINNKAYVMGGNYWGKPGIGDVVSPWRSGLQYNLHHMVYEKMDIVVRFRPMSKVAGGKIAWVKGNNGLLSTLSESAILDLSDGYYSGSVSLGFDSVATQMDSVQKLQWSAGDDIEWRIHRDGVFNTTSTVMNHTTGKTSKSTFTGFWGGSGGLWNLVFLKDSFQVTTLDASSQARKNVPLWVGDSQLGWGVSKESARPVNLIYRNNTDYFNQVCLPAVEGRYVKSSGIMKELLHDLNPPKTVLCLFYNDVQKGQTAASSADQLDSLIKYCQDSSSIPYVMGLVPSAFTTDPTNDSFQIRSARRGLVFFPLRDVLKDANGQFYKPYSWDDVHYNNLGAKVVANTTVATPGFDLYNAAANDSSLAIVNYDSKAIPTPDSYTSKEFIPNAFSNASPTAGSGYPMARIPNTSVATDRPIYTDSCYGTGAVEGLEITYAYAKKNNLVFTNLTGGGISYGHVFPTFGASANNNQCLQTISSKGSYTSTINGSYNFFAGVNTGVGTVSGSNNFDVGLSASPSGLTSGNRNVRISGSVGQTTGSDAILIGTAAFGWGNFSNRMLMGTFDNGTPAMSNVWAFQMIGNGAVTGYPGGYRQYSGSFTMKGAEMLTTNANGVAQAWVASAGNGTGTDGGIALRSFNPSDQTTEKNTLVVQNNRADMSASVGIVFPKMTTAARTGISSPVEGTGVYDTDLHKLYVYDGTSWQAAW